MTNLILWQPDAGELIPAAAKTPTQIAEYAAQLSVKDRRQIASALEGSHYEMALNYLWQKTIGALKKELGTVGVTLLGEMLGRADVDEDDDVDDLLTDREAIRLAGELGVISATDALRLQHTFELVLHFSQMESIDSDSEQIDESEALASFKACIKAVLGRPKVEVARKFVDFRTALENESIGSQDERVALLRGSPYFFCKLTVSVLMNAARRNHGAQLEHGLANANVLIPEVWPRLRDAEKWSVGQAYAEAYANGRSVAAAGIKKVLLKVNGFDYVPENLRSEAFIRAAEAVIKAHEGLNNFYNEASPVASLVKLGTTIPTPAIPACMSALLCVVLGNRYGVAWAATVDANKALNKLSPDRWAYYFNHVLPSDIRILSKLQDEKPRLNWIEVVKNHVVSQGDLKGGHVASLIRNTLSGNHKKIGEVAGQMVHDFYNSH